MLMKKVVSTYRLRSSSLHPAYLTPNFTTYITSMRNFLNIMQLMTKVPLRDVQEVSWRLYLPGAVCKIWCEICEMKAGRPQPIG
jgi:hypothetical protein